VPVSIELIIDIKTKSSCHFTGGYEKHTIGYLKIDIWCCKYVEWCWLLKFYYKRVCE